MGENLLIEAAYGISEADYDDNHLITRVKCIRLHESSGGQPEYFIRRHWLFGDLFNNIKVVTVAQDDDGNYHEKDEVYLTPFNIIRIDDVMHVFIDDLGDLPKISAPE